jgi:phage terminase small subunit
MPAKKAAPKKKALTPAAKKRAATMRQQRRDAIKFENFCQRYVLTGNGTQSFLDAYSMKSKPIKATSAATESYKLLRKPETIQRIKELRIESHNQLMVSYEETLQEIAGLAMFDPRNLFSEEGELLQLHEMDPVTRKMVHEIEINLDLDTDHPLRVAKVKYGKDKRAYLDMLMKHYNGYDAHRKAGAGKIQVLMYCAQDANL